MGEAWVSDHIARHPFGLGVGSSVQGKFRVYLDPEEPTFRK